MAANEGKITRFPGGVGQFTFMAVGATAGDVTVTGVHASDELLLVQAVAFDADGDIVSVDDLTAEFSVSAANTISNSGGTSTADSLVSVTVARTKDES